LDRLVDEAKRHSRAAAGEDEARSSERVTYTINPEGPWDKLSQILLEN
jgi:hypothetical protein